LGAITQADVDELGDVDEALAQFYVQAIENVLQQSDISEFELRNWFERKLITPAETRGTVYQGDDTEGLDNRVVALLANQYLLRAETRAGGTWYELVHDRFVVPILQANREWRALQSPLIQAAAKWHQNGRRRQDLYAGNTLKSAMAAANRDTLPALVQSFLTASEDAQSKQELEAEAKRSRTLRWLLGALGVALLAAIIATVLAFNASQSAQLNEEEALQQRSTAEAASTLAVEQQGAAEAASTRAVAEQITAQAASTAAVDERNLAEVASTSAVEERATAVAASTAAVAAQETAQAAQITTEHQRRLLQAQALAFQSPNVADSESAVLLALEAYNINRDEDGDLEAMVDQAVRNALTVPAFTTILAEFSTPVQTMAVSPDGRWLAVADENSVMISSLVEPNLSSIRNEIYTSNLAFSANSRNLFVLTYFDTIIQINLDDLEAPATTSRDNLSSYYGVMASTHQGSIIALANEDGIELWNSETGEVEQRLPLTDNPVVIAATFSQDDTILAAISQNSLWIWDITNLDAPPVEITDEPLVDLRSVVLSPDGRWVAISNFYGEIYLFSLSNLASFISFGGWEGDGVVTSLIFTPDSQQVISANNNHSIRVWEVETGLPTAVYNYHNDSVNTIALSPDGSKLFSGSDDRTVRQLFLNRPDLQPTVQTPYDLNSVTYSPDGRWLAMGTDNCSVLLVHVNDLNDFSHELLNSHIEYVNDAVFSPDGRYLASAGMDDIIIIWELSDNGTATAIETLTGHTDNIQALAYSPNSQQLASASLDGTVKLWRMTPPNSSLIDTIDQSEIVHSVAFSPDGTTLAFDRTISGLGGSVRCDSFGGGGGGGGGGGSEEDYGVALWSVDDGIEPLHFFPSSFSDINTVTYSPDGQLLAAGGNDRAVRLWSLADFDAVPLTLSDYKGSVDVVLFSPDGRFFATLDNHSTVRLYSATNLAQPPSILTSDEYILEDLTFSPDSQTLAAVGSKDLLLWPVLDVLVTTGCGVVTRNFTWTEWQSYFGDEPYRQTCPQLPVHYTVPKQP
jgi:WD40 repeat protein